MNIHRPNLLQELQEKTARARQILDGAEGRSMSRREKSEFDRLTEEAEKLGERLVASQIDPRLAQGQLATGERSRTSELLRPDERVSDYLVEHRGGGSHALGEESSFNNLSFGKIVRAAVTGERRNLNESERRAMAEGVDSAGGYAVGEELSSTIIDLARASAVCFEAGARTAIMHTDTLNLARLATGNTAAWKLENDPLVSSDQVWERIQLVAKTVVVEQILSTELYEDLSGEADAIIRGEIAKSIGLKIDLAILEGAGTGAEPRGILNTSGVNSIDMGTNGGQLVGFDNIVSADFACRKNNGQPATAAVMNPRDAESLALFKASDGQPLRRPPSIDTLPFLTTTQVRADRTKGSSSNTSSIFVGDFSQVVVAVRPSLQIRFQVLGERHASNLQIGFLAWARLDVGLMHPAHLTKIIGVKP